MPALRNCSTGSTAVKPWPCEASQAASRPVPAPISRIRAGCLGKKSSTWAKTPGADMASNAGMRCSAPPTYPVMLVRSMRMRCNFGFSALSGLRRRPRSELIASGLCEVEPAAAWKCEDRLDHLATRSLDFAQRTFEVVTVEHKECTPGLCASRKLRPEEAAIQSLVRERDVIGTVILEFPAKCLAEESLRSVQVPRRVLNVVDLLV